MKDEWAGAELNRRHVDFQSTALPPELPTRTALSFLILTTSYIYVKSFSSKKLDGKEVSYKPCRSIGGLFGRA
jgi:hypothetical protein